MPSGSQNESTNSPGDIGEAAVNRILSRIIVRLERNPTRRADLMQEARVHLWSEAGRNPGHTLSWYLQNCRFHLQHLNARGRSVDSPKRAQNRMSIHSTSGDLDELFGAPAGEANILSEVSAKEIMLLLSSRLTPRQRTILNCLADGRGTCEIARLLNVSHPAVIKNRCKIAALAAELGFAAEYGIELHRPSRLHSTRADPLKVPPFSGYDSGSNIVCVSKRDDRYV